MMLSQQLYMHEIVFGGGDRWKNNIPVAMLPRIVQHLKEANKSLLGIVMPPEKESDRKGYEIGYVERFEMTLVGYAADISHEVDECADRHKLTFIINSEPTTLAKFNQLVARVRETSPFFSQAYL